MHGAPTDAGYLSAVEECRRRAPLVENVHESRAAGRRQHAGMDKRAATRKGRRDA